MKRPLLLLSLVLLIFSCKEKEAPLENPNCSRSTLQYFGFSLVDVAWDDPLDDPSDKTNYIDEVANFSNIADILVIGPTDNIVSRLQQMDNFAVKAYLHLNALIFELVDDQAPSGTHYRLRSDYQMRWDLFVESNALVGNAAMIQAFYLGEEPFWNGIDFEELKAAADYIKNSFPNIPIMMIEAYPVLNQMEIPSSIDWIGFDHYFIKDPNTSPEFQEELAILKSKLVTEEQRIVLVMDSHYIEWAHGAIGGISLDEMKTVANNYYQLALAEKQTIALIAYFWPSGFDDPMALGARHMPTATIEEYKRIGKAITGK